MDVHPNNKNFEIQPELDENTKKSLAGIKSTAADDKMTDSHADKKLKYEKRRASKNKNKSSPTKRFNTLDKEYIELIRREKTQCG